MKKIMKRLNVNGDTVRHLNSRELELAVGGERPVDTKSCVTCDFFCATQGATGKCTK